MRHHPHLRLIQGDATLLLVAAAAGADKAQELDRELLACVTEAEAADREAEVLMNRLEAMDDADPDLGPALDAARPLLASYNDAVARAAQLPARSPEGLRATAVLLLRHAAAECDVMDLALSLARDVAGRVRP
jgi:hypothetical protein